MKKTVKGIIALIFAVVTALCLFAFTSSAADEGKWITTWSTAPTQIGIEGYDNIEVALGDVTARSVITPTASGTKLRVKFSNYYGDKPLKIARATVAISMGGSKIAENTVKPLTFNNGYAFVTVPAGGEVYSDGIPFDTTAGQDIAVSTYLEEFSEIKTMGLSGGATYLSAGEGKDMTAAADFNLLNNLDLDKKLYSFLNGLLGSIVNLDPAISYSFIKVVPVIASVEVLSENDEAYSVVIIGDSTVSNEFPLYLGQVINDEGITDIGISGKGIIGNRLLGDGLGYGSLLFGESLLTRMKRDIIGLDGKNQSNVKYVIVKIGANDIMHPVCTDIMEMYPGIKQPSAQEIIDGYKQVFEFCHDNGIKVIAVGITQWKGNKRDYLGTGEKYIRSEAQFKADWQIAKDVNAWLASTSLHDGYITYNEISANPNDPDAFLPEYTIDGAHPSDKLQKLWAKEFPLSLVGVGDRVAGIGVSETDLTIFKGQSSKLTAAVAPSNASNKSVIWTSSNTSVATVDSNGKITAVGKGEAVISVKTVDKGYSGVGYTAKCKVKVVIKPASVTINGSENVIYTTKTVKLSATVLPSDAYSKNVNWSSSNNNVATVDANGLVTAVGKGTAVITAKSAVDASVKATFTVTVKKKVSVQAVALNITEKTKYTGTTLKLKATVSPAKASFPEVKWTSSDPKVATVSADGKVKALKAGTAVITCKSVDNPMCKATCVVTVKVKTTGVELSKTTLSMYVTQKVNLKATVLPSDATNKKVKWTSSNKKVATVSSSGKITAKKPGKVTITAKTKNGGYIATCKVTVSKYVASKTFKLKKTSVKINDGKTYTLKTVFTPSNASNKSVTWKSSNTKVATVSSKGVVKGINPGTCTITGKSKDSGKTVTCKVTVKKVKVKSVAFGEKVYEVALNKKLKLKAVISPSNATNQKITWKSNKPKYVKVSSSGKVTGLKAGKTATITATTADGKKVATCKVKVITIPLKGVKLNKTAATTGVGGSITLTPKFTPSNASNKKVKWTSSDPKIAAVSEDGIVTPLKDGKVTITCTTVKGGYTASCTVTVKTISVLGVKLDKTSLYANIGAVFNLNATVSPTNASNKKVNWTSTDTSVATVSSNGKVTAVGTGTCYIRATTVSGKKMAQCKITVK